MTCPPLTRKRRPSLLPNFNRSSTSVWSERNLDSRSVGACSLPDVFCGRRGRQGNRSHSRKALFVNWCKPFVEPKKTSTVESTTNSVSTGDPPSPLGSVDGDFKTVRFAPSSSQHDIPSLQSMSLQEKSLVWYTSSERYTMRMKAERSAISLSNLSGFSVGVDKSFREARYLAVITMDGIQAAKFMKSEKKMNKHCRSLLITSSDLATDSLRGLEDFVVSKQSRYERLADSRESRAVVVELSKSLRKRQWTFDDERLSVAYGDMTRTAAILARFYALADQQAAATESLEI